ncbi:MAG: type ISP restriction/modification enzyme [Sandarakinorhabdus sp.]
MRGARHKFYGSGFKTQQDEFAIAFTPAELQSNVERLLLPAMTEDLLRTEFSMCGSEQWNFHIARKRLSLLDWRKEIVSCQYRPFDYRFSIIHQDIISNPRFEIMNQYKDVNIGLCLGRQGQVLPDPWNIIFVTNRPQDQNLFYRGGNTNFPLWLKPSGTETRTLPNIAPAFANRVAALTGLAWDDCVEGPKQGALAGVIAPKPTQTAMFAARRERGEPGHSFGPRDLFDWIYAVLHSPAYRSRYADYLKSDFARVPLPGSRALFEALVPLGAKLVALHLLDATAAPDLADPKPVRFVGSGEPRVAAKPEFKAGRVHINPSCWFQDVPERAWNFHIGGYQPAQKWLKDRAAKGGKKASDGRVLTPDDIIHYRRMITAMDATIDIMAEIDRVIDQHGGWPGAFRGMTDAGAA